MAFHSLNTCFVLPWSSLSLWGCLNLLAYNFFSISPEISFLWFYYFVFSWVSFYFERRMKDLALLISPVLEGDFNYFEEFM